MGAARIVLLGSTGSIGRSVLRVAAEHPERFQVVALAAGADAGALAGQAREARPEAVSLADEGAAGRFAADTGLRTYGGPAGAIELATAVRGDILVNAMVGAAGLRPTLAAIGHYRRICLANKESLVAGGEIVMRRASEAGTEILPIDSEHVALHRCLDGRREGVRRLVLTASGGPFRSLPAEGLRRATPEDALAHPTWVMGKKITIDSATLMNKGLEVIEAMHLFAVPAERIEVVVHPQSVIHSLVEFVDRSYLAEIGETDMRHAIRYALCWPERLAVAEPFDLAKLPPLTFEEPDPERFPCLRLAYEAAARGGTAPAVLNAANEVAVRAFLDRRIGFADIPVLVEETGRRVPWEARPLEVAVFAADEAARREAGGLLAPGGALAREGSRG